MSHKEGEGRSECQGGTERGNLPACTVCHNGNGFKDCSSHPGSQKGEKEKKNVIHKRSLINSQKGSSPLEIRHACVRVLSNLCHLAALQMPFGHGLRERLE